MWFSVFEGLIIPFAGTALGSACVFFMKKELGRNMQRALTGFASGISLFPVRQLSIRSAVC